MTTSGMAAAEAKGAFTAVAAVAGAAIAGPVGAEVTTSGLASAGLGTGIGVIGSKLSVEPAIDGAAKGIAAAVGAGSEPGTPTSSLEKDAVIAGATAAVLGPLGDSGVAAPVSAKIGGAIGEAAGQTASQVVGAAGEEGAKSIAQHRPEENSE